MSIPAPEIVLVPMTVAERAALAQLPQMLAAMSAANSVMPPLRAMPPVHADPGTKETKTLGELAAAVGVQVETKDAPAVAAEEPEVLRVEVDANDVEVVPTVDELRAACARYAEAHGGNAAALKRMAALGYKRIGDVPVPSRAAFLAAMS